MTIRRWSLLAAMTAVLTASLVLRAQDAAPEAAAPEAAAPEAAAPEAPAAADEKVKLDMVLPAGQWLLNQTSKSESYATVDGVGQPSQQTEMAMQLGLTVAQPDAEGAIPIGLTVKSLVVDIRVGPASLHYDSTGKGQQDAMLKPLLTPVAQMDLKLRILPDGQIAEIEGRGGAWEKVLESNPQVRPLLEGLKDYLGDVRRGSLQAGAGLMPAEPVAVNDSWTARLERSVPMLGDLEIAYKAQLDKLEKAPAGTVAAVSFTGKARKPQPGQKMTLQDAVMRIDDLDSDQTGQVRIDVQSGRVLNYQVTQNTKAKMTVVDALGREKRVALTQKTITGWTLEPAKE